MKKNDREDSVSQTKPNKDKFTKQPKPEPKPTNAIPGVTPSRGGGSPKGMINLGPGEEVPMPEPTHPDPSPTQPSPVPSPSDPNPGVMPSVVPGDDGPNRFLPIMSKDLKVDPIC